MDIRSLDHRLTAEESLKFERDGFFTIENAIPDEMVQALISAVDRTDAAFRKREGIESNRRSNMLDFIGKDDLFLELLDWYQTFPKVWELLGWNIQLYHTHVAVTPNIGEGKSLEVDGPGVGFHQDSGRLNTDMETSPRPRISLKVAFFLTDTTEPGRGNFYVIPGSHNLDDFPGEGRKEAPPEAVPVLLPAGSAAVFDRRIWHSASANYWHEPRRVLFYGYSYRWLRPRDDMEVDHYMGRCDPIQRQLLGASPSGGHGYTSPKPEDVPLKAWIEEHVGEEAVVR